jgi:DNA-binding XRE family transcriptional regulator
VNKEQYLRRKFDTGEITALTYYRTVSGMEIDELAEVVGVAPKVIFKLERKRVKFPKHLAHQIAEALSIETEMLFEGYRP